MTAIPLDKRTQDLWAHELESLDQAVSRIESEARSYSSIAESCQAYAPELAFDYLNWAEWATGRAQRARTRRKQIQDYLAGKIAPGGRLLKCPAPPDSLSVEE